MKILQFFLLLLILTGVAVGTAVYLGIYNFAADEPHYRIVEDFIRYVRHRSIEARSYKIPVPTDLNHEQRIIRGAGNYDAMCVGCHLKPGLENTEIRRSLYPQPPDLSRRPDNPAEQFWIIKHGLKMTGMPAWGKGGMDDEDIWDMVALLQDLPAMSAEKYADLVASSEGHSHDGMRSEASAAENTEHAPPEPGDGESGADKKEPEPSSTEATTQPVEEPDQQAQPQQEH